MAPLETITGHLRAQLHPAALRDELLARRHLAFVVVQLTIGLLFLAMLPVALALNGRLDSAAAAGLAWVVAPPALATFLALTGRLGAALVLSSLCLAGALCQAGMLTGGSASPVVAGLALVPLIAAQAGSREATLGGSAAAVAVLLALVILPSPGGAETMSLAFVSTAATVLGAAAAAGALTGRPQAPSPASVVEQPQAPGDLTTRHGRDGCVLEASPQAADSLGVAASALEGLGLFSLVHVADRPAFLHALSETHASNASRVLDVRLRVRREDGASDFTWFEMCCRPAMDQESEGVTTTLRDVDERKRREAEAAILAAEIERAAEARGRFLAQMTLDLPSSAAAVVQSGRREASRFASTIPFGFERRRGGTLVPLRVGAVEPGAPAVTPLPALRRA